jgi:flavin reductase (DIM6/NTAB) family NADH-FMN oxidoreductase RutF
MQVLQSADIRAMERFYRANLINSITGYKPANLIGTVDAEGQTNLAIFSSLVHLGADPAMVAMVVRPAVVARHSYDNIRATGFWTVNHVHTGIAEQAHYTSAKFPKEVSEFAACGLDVHWEPGFAAPFVADSRVSFGVALREELPIQWNGTILLIGEIQCLRLADGLVLPDGLLDLQDAETLAITGLDSYHAVSPLARYPYAQVEGLPDFGVAAQAGS